MRIYDEKYSDDVQRLNAESWMVDAIKKNPSYPCWGPYEDCMGSGTGWNAPVHYSTWQEFDFKLDELNECVNFYFEINRESKNCSCCGGDGYHPDAKWITESFYKHSSPFYPDSAMNNYPSEEVLQKYSTEFRDFVKKMKRDWYWSDKITEDEFEALKSHNRSHGFKSAKETNKNERQSALGHDCINRSILMKTRCERLGIPYLCPQCNGDGYVYTAENAHLSLVLWMIHPRKGASRGVRVARITKAEMGDVVKYLQNAAKRNAERFDKVTR